MTRFLMVLLAAIILGGITGYFLGPEAEALKPLGDIFLNLMFTFVVPLVFFSVASAVAGVGEARKIGKITVYMMAVFLITGFLAAIYMLLVVKLFPPASQVHMQFSHIEPLATPSLGQQLVNIFTVSDFLKVFSRENMLALIIFAALVGFATASLEQRGRELARLLQLGAEVFMKIIAYIMYLAPIGFFAYFAILTAEMGPEILHNYSRAFLVYYGAASLYFVVVYTFYAYLADRKAGVQNFWRQVSLPALTSLATCSSAASIPANLQATEKMKLPPEVYEMVVPLGSLIHKEGSILGAMVKIAFLYGLLNLDFASPHTLVLAILISILAGVVIGAIPSGGMIAEMLILSLFGFPPEYLMVIVAIGLLIDPLATMLNVTGNTIASMLVTKLLRRSTS